jgi:hypothetical protein
LRLENRDHSIQSRNAGSELATDTDKSLKKRNANKKREQTGKTDKRKVVEHQKELDHNLGCRMLDKKRAENKPENKINQAN